jgi:RNA polymerase sigma-70 factor (ECF subfamily)
MGIARPISVAIEQAGTASQEAALVAELRAGSEEAFSYLLAVYQTPVYNLVSHIVESSSDVPDVTQSVFIKVFRGIKFFHGQSSLKTWIYRIAVHEAANHRRGWLRRKLREAFSLDETEEFPDRVLARSSAHPETPYEVAANSERQRHVQRALASLAQPYRTVVVLREIEELSYEDIAAVLGVSEGTVKSRLIRGRELLRRKLQGVWGHSNV